MKYAKPRVYDHTSRYSIYRQIINNENDVYIETSNRTPIEKSDKDIYHEVQREEENRLDIIANKYYGDPDLFWIIAMGNDMIDPFVVKVGDIIRIPYFFSLNNWGGALYGRI